MESKQADLQQAEVEFQVDIALAQANVDNARAAVTNAELQLAYTEIHAPIGGRIGRHLVDIGNLVQTEMTLLATIEAYDPIYVYFTISETQVLYFTRLRQQKKLPPLGSVPIVLQMGLGDEEGFPHEGRFDFAELGVDPETGTTLRRGIFPNPDGTIVPGLFARVRGAVGDPSPRLLVPERALGADQQGRYVLVVNDQNVVEHRSVTPGIKVEGLRVVEQGLKGDEWVVVDGLLRARPGAKVDPQRGDAPAFGRDPATAAPEADRPARRRPPTARSRPHPPTTEPSPAREPADRPAPLARQELTREGPARCSPASSSTARSSPTSSRSSRCSSACVALCRLPVEQYPEITPPTVQVATQSIPAPTREVVADTVAAPIEQQVNGVENMLYMSSTCSSDGSYTLTVTFEIGTDLDMAQVLVQNRVAIAEPQLPEEVRRQGVTVKKQSTNIILVVVADLARRRRYDSLFLSQLRHAADPRRAEPRPRRRRRDGLRRRQLQHAGLARPGEAQGPQPDHPGRGRGDPRAERAGRRRPGRPAARRPTGRTSSTPSTTLGRLSDAEQFENIIVKTGEGDRGART